MTWIPKWERDQKLGVDSPMPTQIVSNEEFIPRPQNADQRKVETLIGELADKHSKRLNMDRRAFLRTGMGLAAAFYAQNVIYGKDYWDVDAQELEDADMVEEKWPKGEYFVFDVQAHFTNGVALPFRSMEFVKNMGFNLKNDVDAYSFPTFVKEMFFDSETAMVCISGVPGKEINRGEDGQILEREERTPGFAILPSWLMAERRNQINEIAGCQRALCQGNCAPNHYWDKASNSANYDELFEQMEREVKLYGIDSWKWYCHTDPGRSGDGFRLDDEGMTYKFYEKSRELGMKLFSVHKGYASQSRTLGHFAHPGDVEKAALDNPDLTFVVYHSALRHDPREPGFQEDGFYNPETGDFMWHADLINIKKRNPNMTNVYPEIGSAFGSLAIQHPEMCQHLMGRNIKYYGSDHVIWGTDCLWWGSPQWVVDALKRFQISDELCEKFGYEKVTKEDKANIFGLNAARLYNVDVNEKRNALPKDTISRVKQAYLGEGFTRDNLAYGWVRDDTRRA